ncbi:hypothetical protein AAMO2058_000013200 [Amorphochlora amoebiformis]
MEGLIGKMQKVGSRLAGFLDENKIKIAAVGTLAGSAYIATKLSPYAETAKFMMYGIYSVTRQTINRVVTGGEGEEDTKEGDTPLTRQFEKILATGDRLVEIQAVEDPFRIEDGVVVNDGGLYAKLSKIFDLKAIRAGMKKGRKDEEEYRKWNEFLVAGISQAPEPNTNTRPHPSLCPSYR